MFSNNSLHSHRSGWAIWFESVVGVWLDRVPMWLLFHSLGLPPFAMTDSDGMALECCGMGRGWLEYGFSSLLA